jgi:hypothetical protein
MTNELTQFAQRHWVLGGIFVSLLWFLAGKQSLSNGRPSAAVLWQSVGIVILLILCGWAVADRQWLGLAFGIAVFCVEVSSIRSIYATRSGSR